MEDESSRLADKAQELGDVELAVLLCLIAGEHCIIEADAEDVEHAEQELQSVCRNTFSLNAAILHCRPDMSVDDFGDHILIRDKNVGATSKIDHQAQQDSFFSSDAANRRRIVPQSPALEDDRRIADVVIARDLHLAPLQVQVQALELIRSKRIFTRKAIQTAPRRFLLVALNTADADLRMTLHLNDHFYISHFYQSKDAIAEEGIYHHANTSTGSVVRSAPVTPGFSKNAGTNAPLEPLFPNTEIDLLAKLSTAVKLHPDVRAYLHNVVVFMRMHRAIASGVTPHATRHLYTLTSALATLHGLDFITPSLVALAVRKIYPHRLVIVKPEDEMSLQWGSELDAVKEYLEGVTNEDIIDDVLGKVEAPL